MGSETPPDWVVDRLFVLGKRIRAVREAQGLSQEDLGRATRLGRGRIGQVGRGTYDARLDDLLLIAYVLDVPPADLVAG